MDGIVAIVLYAPILSTTYARDCGTILIVEAMIVITIIPRKNRSI